MSTDYILEFPAEAIRNRRRFIDGALKEVRRLRAGTPELAWYEEQLTDIYDTQLKLILDGDLMGAISQLAGEVVRLRSLLRDAGIDYSE